MSIDCSREKVIKVIQNYLQGDIDYKEASDQALYVIRSRDWEGLPGDVSSAVHLLFDLHDNGRAWCPSREELERCKAKLEMVTSQKLWPAKYLQGNKRAIWNHFML